MILSLSELRTITSSVQRRKIAEELLFMGIPFRLSKNGTPVVLKSDFETFARKPSQKKPSWQSPLEITK